MLQMLHLESSEVKIEYSVQGKREVENEAVI